MQLQMLTTCFCALQFSLWFLLWKQ